MVEKEAIGKAVNEVVPGHDIREVWLYGSYARGDQADGSDVDLRFLCGNHIGFAELYDIQQQLEKRIGQPLDIVTAPPEQMRQSFWNHIKKDQVLLYGA